MNFIAPAPTSPHSRYAIKNQEPGIPTRMVMTLETWNTFSKLREIK